MTGRRTRFGGRLAAILLVTAVAVSLAAPGASAHGFLERSEPPNGGMVAVGRTSLTLWFSEPISADASNFELQTLDGIRAGISVSMSTAGGRGVVEVETEPLLKATYLLDWAVLSLVDGHPYRGSVLFGVGARPEVVPSTGDTLPGTPSLLMRWLDLSALMLAVGALAVSGRVLGSMGAAGEAPGRRARYIGAMAAGVGVVTGAITAFLRVPRGGRDLRGWFEATWSTMTSTDWGRLWLGREVGLLVLVLLLWSLARHRSASDGRWPVAVLALAAVIMLESWAGHASTLSRQSELAGLASASHLAAAGIWAGGLAVLLTCLLPMMRRNPDSRGPMLASVWKKYSPMAGIATVVLLATGVYESGRHLPDLGSVFSTVYGGAVGAKVVLLVGALLLAGFNTLLVNPHLAAPVGRFLGRPDGWAPVSLRRFTSVVTVEAIVLVVAVGAGALLTSVPTAREIDLAARETGPRSLNAEGLFTTFEVVPAGVDQSRLIVRTSATVKPGPGPVSGIDVLLVAPAGATTVTTLNQIEPGRFEKETAKLTPGSWEASVEVHRENAADAVMPFQWDVPITSPEGARPLEIVATALAVLLLAALVGAIRFTRRRPQDAVETMPLVYERTGSQL